MSYRHGALYVIEDARPHHEIAEQLRRLDDRLFLERQLTFAGEEVWCVVCSLGGDHPPATILEWRDSDGRPIHELSSGLVDRVARMERDGARLTAEVVKRNREMVERGRRNADAEYQAIAEEIVPLINDKRSSVLHRGQHLRMSRDKQRAKGRKL